jgi:hypothetical protein
MRWLTLATAMTAAAGEAQAARCTDYTSCRQAVVAWCAGDHPRADGDDDGIPCENLCSTRAEVVAIMAEIGCSR